MYTYNLLNTAAVAMSFYATGSATKHTQAEKLCCTSLVSAGLENIVLFPKQAAYKARLNSYWSASAALRPWCMALPLTAEDVSIIISTLVKGDCPFGVRSGGHGSFALSSGVENGVTIDLGNMRQTVYDTETKVVSLQPGGRWQDVYEKLAPYGVTVTGGRTGSVGVGGFLTGGGNSFHSASHGMACDTVVNYEVVIANGSIINANIRENADLWVALKGGSANFGLVTRFDLRTIQFPDPTRPEIWGEFLSFDPAAGNEVVDAMVAFTENAHLDQNTTSIMYFGHIPAAGGSVIHLGLENTRGVAKPAAVGVYYNINKTISTNSGVIPMTELVRSESPAQLAGFRNIWFTLSFKNDARVMKYAAEQHSVAVRQLAKVLSPNSTFNSMCAFQPLNKIIAEHGVRSGGNVMGLDYWMARQDSGGNGILFLAQLSVQGDEDEKKAFPIMENWTNLVEAYAKKLGVGWGWKYLNYAGKGQNPLALSSVGPDAFKKLAAASRKYDPNSAFQRLRGSGFKLSRVE